jgi:leucine dehydrogenase
MKENTTKLQPFSNLNVSIHPNTGVVAYIAIHSVALGAAIGGTRLNIYPSQEDAEIDALRLAMGMSYKAAVAGLLNGGGKAVLMVPSKSQHLLDPTNTERKELFKWYGHEVERLGGHYVTTEDVGTNPHDMDNIRLSTKYVLGGTGPGGSGDPSPYTAHGVFRGLESLSAFSFDCEVHELSYAVIGVGHVGGGVVQHLIASGAHVTVSDVTPEIARARLAELEAKGVNTSRVVVTTTEAILNGRGDVLVPCALGGLITENYAQTMNYRAVAGAANNQLLTDKAGVILFQRDIIYVPDYVINAGGLISVASEYHGWNHSVTTSRVNAIGATVTSILEQSKQEDKPTVLVANAIAEACINDGRCGPLDYAKWAEGPNRGAASAWEFDVVS